MNKIFRAETESGRPIITLFDSGLGGSALAPYFMYGSHHKHFDDYDINLVADHAGLPYGDKDASYILGRVACAIERSAEKGSDTFVIACNTASAVCLGPEGDERSLQSPINRWRESHPNKKVRNMKIVGIIRPAALELKRDIEREVKIGLKEVKKGDTGDKKKGIRPGQPIDVMLFATQRTVESGAYVDAIRLAFTDPNNSPDKETLRRNIEIHSRIKVCAVACPGLADAIENCHNLPTNSHNDYLLDFFDNFAKKMERELRNNSFTALIPGCTHYWFIHDLIKRSLKINGVTVHNDVLNDANIAEYMVEYLGLDILDLFFDPQRKPRGLFLYSTKPESELTEKTSAFHHLFKGHEGVPEAFGLYKNPAFEHLELGNLAYPIDPKILEDVDHPVRAYTEADIGQPLPGKRQRLRRPYDPFRP